MNIFVLLYNSGTDKEGIHSIELRGRTIVLMFPTSVSNNALVIFL